MTIKIPLHQILVEQEEWREPQVPSTGCFLTPQHLFQQRRSNAQPNGHHIAHVQHVDKVTFTS